MESQTNLSKIFKRPAFLKRKFIILPDFQKKLIFSNLFTSGLTFLVVSLNLLFSVGKMRSMGESAGFSPNHPYFMFVSEMFQSLFLNVSIAFVLSSVLGVLASVFISHRIAGPIYRLVKYFENLNQGGEISEIHFRKGDYLYFFADTVNSVMKKIRSKPES